MIITSRCRAAGEVLVCLRVFVYFIITGKHAIFTFTTDMHMSLGSGY